jgi:2,4-dienoyl-CoA reductase-like NADH-dependent reductase (Old Yellow Enzyme family)
MSRLFESSAINGMTLTNRFVRSATWEGMADKDGSVTPMLVSLMQQLARGQVGLIVSSHAYISPEGQAGPRQLGVYSDDLVDGLRQMAEAVHQEGGKIVLQLAHSGCLANPKLTGQPALGPSGIEGITSSPLKEMDQNDIHKLMEAFGQAARRAREAGFDGVELHGAHGYLMNQFLSPYFNKRTDGYGGSLEGRYQALKEVLQRVRAAVGADFPVLTKLNSQDFLEGGLSLEDSLKIGKWLESDGIDAIELSGGTLRSGKNSPSRMAILQEEKEAYFSEAALAFKKEMKIPIMLVGGIRSLTVAEKIIDQGKADYISMSRPFIREPGLVKRWKSGDVRKAACLSDNQCFGPAMAGEGIYCVVEKKEKNNSPDRQ